MRTNLEYRDDTPVIEVRVFSDDHLVAFELCEDERHARDVVDRWAELPEVSFLVDNYSCKHVVRPTRAAERPVTAVDTSIAAAALDGVGWE